jgi:pimeloyl-ACP methyl ester carboxylesterase
MTAQRLVVALAAWLVTAGLAVTADRGADAPDLRCGQEPGTRFFWTEWGFCDLEPHGPEKARGLVIWNHGISGTEVQYKAPPALAMRLLHARGWDIIKLNRNNLGGTTSTHLALARLKERNEAETRAQLARGYRRVALAGQSFGGYAALETAAGSRDVFGVVAMAPGATSFGVNRLDPSITERLIVDIKARRLALVFPQGDAFFDNRVRGPGALSALAARPAPYLVIDETAALSGHEGGTGGRFALRYGPCLADFLDAADSPPPGRVACPAGREAAAARDLLMKPWPAAARPPRDGDALAGFAPPSGDFWYGLMGETVVTMIVLRGEGDTLRVFYRVANPQPGGGMHPARLHGDELRASLGEGRVAAIALRRVSANRLELHWTPPDGGRTLRTTLSPAGDLE